MFQALLSILFFDIYFGLYLGLERDHAHNLGLELPEVPPTTYDPPGYQKWPYKPAWALSIWPGHFHFGLGIFIFAWALSF